LILGTGKELTKTGEKRWQALEEAKSHKGLLMMMSMIAYHLQLHFS